MKVSNVGPPRGGPEGRRRAGGGGGAEFARALDRAWQGPPASPADDAQPAAGVESLLAIQELAADGGKGGESAAAQRHGEDLLARLDRLRLDLIAGAVPRERLEALARAVRGGRAETSDPRLQAILEEIELRAEVELAKLDAAR